MALKLGLKFGLPSSELVLIRGLIPDHFPLQMILRMEISLNLLLLFKRLLGLKVILISGLKRGAHFHSASIEAGLLESVAVVSVFGCVVLHDIVEECVLFAMINVIILTRHGFLDSFQAITFSLILNHFRNIRLIIIKSHLHLFLFTIG